MDDEPRIHDVVKTTLTNANIAQQIDDFFDPTSFLESLAENKTEPDLLILDVISKIQVLVVWTSFHLFEKLTPTYLLFY